MIREALMEDIPRIVELGSRSLQDGPYKDRIQDNPVQAAKFAGLIIGGFGKVLLWEEEGKVSGLFAFIAYPHFFDAVMTAQEIMWYVEPEARSGGAAIKLLWAAEEKAKELGVKVMQVTAPNKEVGNLYVRFGYKPAEIVFERRF